MESKRPRDPAEDAPGEPAAKRERISPENDPGPGAPMIPAQHIATNVLDRHGDLTLVAG